ncbi:hypothetical protein ACQP60_18825 [Isoptericola variabilis]|uniref:hypothetical protein n=1 Tax=Isoptericola variabilis TaxID=139208 RepID=UPI003D244D9D
MSAPTLTPAEVGARGRARSVQTCTTEQVDATLRAIAAVRAGTEFSVNLVRRQLDDARVPTVARAGLFRIAVAEKLIEPVYVTGPGFRQQRREPSTGRSAHGAGVLIYRRTHTPYRAGG